MAMNEWVRRWMASAVSVSVAVGTNGCYGVATQTQNEDTLVRSTRLSRPTGESAFSAELSADAGKPIGVRAFRQDECALTEHQVLDRTIVSTTAPSGREATGVHALMGAGALAGAAVMGVQAVRTPEASDPGDTSKLKRSDYLIGAATLTVISGWLLGGFLYQKIASGEKRRHIGQVESDKPMGSEPCGTAAPAGAVALTLVNTSSRREFLLRTDSQGQTVIPEAEVANLDAPLKAFVEGKPGDLRVNDAALERVRAAAAAEREKRAVEEARRAEEQRKEDEKRAAEEQRLAQKRLQERIARTTAFRKSVKVGDTSHCGLVVEVKSPVAKLQTMVGERWLRIDQLYSEGDAPCRFFNGVYQDP